MTADELKALFPSLSDVEAALAKENLGRYLLIAWEIREDRCADTDSVMARDCIQSGIEKKPNS